jgi:hypothetical protein
MSAKMQPDMAVVNVQMRKSMNTIRGIETSAQKRHSTNKPNKDMTVLMVFA